MPTPERWKVKDKVELLWHSWGDDHVVFHPASGDTFLMDLVACTCIRCMQRHPFDVPSLSIEIARQLDVDADESLRRYVQALIDRCANLGFLEADDRETA